MTSIELQERLLEELSRSPRGPYALAELIDEPAFRVRAELKELKRQRLLSETLNAKVHLFHLTAAGFARLAGHEQMGLFA